MQEKGCVKKTMNGVVEESDITFLNVPMTGCDCHGYTFPIRDGLIMEHFAKTNKEEKIVDFGKIQGYYKEMDVPDLLQLINTDTQ